METTSQPLITVKRDYEGYFESLVRKWISSKTTPFKHQEIIINSGPYRVDAVTTHSKGNTLELDFYSAIRAGFGSLSEEEVKEIIDLL